MKVHNMKVHNDYGTDSALIKAEVAFIGRKRTVSYLKSYLVCGYSPCMAFFIQFAFERVCHNDKTVLGSFSLLAGGWASIGRSAKHPGNQV
jgi:hypothetical protein